jgi:acyl carrier protein
MTQTASRDEIVAIVEERLLERVGGGLAAIDPDADLIEMGVKSIDAVLVSGDIEDHFAVEVDPVLLFECRTLNRVADSVLGLVERR